jgi:hypothetical protein
MDQNKVNSISQLHQYQMKEFSAQAAAVNAYFI